MHCPESYESNDNQQEWLAADEKNAVITKCLITQFTLTPPFVKEHGKAAFNRKMHKLFPFKIKFLRF